MDKEKRGATDWFSQTGLFGITSLTPLRGKTNKNYKVTLGGKEFHLKVRQQKGFPSLSKLWHINELLDSHGVPHASVIETIARNKNFPYGAILLEWKDGRSIATLKEYRNRLHEVADALKAIHTIPAPYFENIDLGIRADSYPDFITAVLRVRIERCRKEDLLGPGVETRLTSFLRSIKCGQDISPVLVHRDATKSNILLRSNQAGMLIDWDNAEFTVPLADIARIVFAYKWSFDDYMWNRVIHEYLGTEASKDAEDILAVEYVRNALDGLIFKDTDAQYCQMVIERILQ